MLTWKKQQPIEEDYQELFVSEKAEVEPLGGPAKHIPALYGSVLCLQNNVISIGAKMVVKRSTIMSL